MNKYRSHNCSELDDKEIGKIVHLSGWLHRKRDHGNLLFVDLRDHYGITQCVVENKNKFFPILEKTKPESVLKISGKVVKRSDDTINDGLATGHIEVYVESMNVIGDAVDIPLPVFGEPDYPEDIRLKYRFLDLRRDTLHKNIILRSKIINFIRDKMIKNNFF